MDRNSPKVILANKLYCDRSVCLDKATFLGYPRASRLGQKHTSRPHGPPRPIE